MRDRAELIKEIARFESDISDAKNEIQQHLWDCDEDLYILTRSDILKIFERYLTDEISTEELHLWASFLECREDIGYEQGSKDVIDKVIFWLASPEINYPIDKKLITKLKNQVWSNKTQQQN